MTTSALCWNLPRICTCFWQCDFLAKGQVPKTIAQQLGPAVKAATAPYQCALSTRVGCECIAHAFQAVTELDQEATVTTIDGIGAYDSISRRAMLLGLDRVAGEGGGRLFHSEPSAYLWEDASGTVHTVHQGEGGEQGDPLMPLLFFVRQHADWRPSRGGCSPQRSFCFFWMTSTWCQDPNEWELWRRTTSCRHMRRFECMVERSTFGIERVQSRKKRHTFCSQEEELQTLTDGRVVALLQARKRKENTYPELSQGPGHVWSSWRWRLGAGGP